MQEYLLKVEGLTKVYPGRIAIEDLNFQIRQNSIHGFIGPNGAGKTTTLKILAGLLRADSGAIWYEQTLLSSDQLWPRSKIAWMPDNPLLYLDFTVEDALKWYAEIFSIPKNEIELNLKENLNRFAIEDIRHRLIRNLSKGYKQRVGLAQLMMSKPDLIILDEPTNGLDPLAQVEFRKILKDLSRHSTLIISSHLLSELENLCDDFTVIHQGKIKASGGLAQLRKEIQVKQILNLILDLNDQTKLNCLKEWERSFSWSTTQKNGELQLTINSTTTQDFRAELVNFLVHNEISVKGLELQKVELEDLFLKLTSGDAK